MNKNKVYEIYEKIWAWYDENRAKHLMEREYLDNITHHIPQNGKILDLGCGTGEPIAQFFIDRGYSITGIDASQKMIDLCLKRFPQSTFLLADMRNLKLNEKFDAIIAWDSFFHLPPEDQRSMFPVFARHLNPNGILVFTSGPQASEVWSDNNGEQLYHASLSIEEYNILLESQGFNVIKNKIEDPACGNHTVWEAIYSLSDNVFGMQQC